MKNRTDNLSLLFNSKQRKILSGFMVVFLSVFVFESHAYWPPNKETACDRAQEMLGSARLERGAACKNLGSNSACSDDSSIYARCIAIDENPDEFSREDISTQCPYYLQDRITELKEDSRDLNSELRDLRDGIRLHRKDNERTKERMEDRIQELEEKALQADAKANEAASRVTEEMEKAYGSRSQQMNEFTRQLREITVARDAAKAQLGLAGDQEFLKADVTMKEYCYKRAFEYVEQRSQRMRRSQRSASDILSMSQGDYSTELARRGNARYARCMRSENSARARHLQRVRDANLRVQDIEITSAEQQILDMRRQISEYSLRYSQQLQGIEERAHSESLASFQEAQTYREEAARLKLTIQQAAGSGNQQDYYMDLQEYNQKIALKRERESELRQLEKTMPRRRISLTAFREAKAAVGKYQEAVKYVITSCKENEVPDYSEVKTEYDALED